jgi:folate-dependent tRNA-U54 methylase TrmFO/GidA
MVRDCKPGEDTMNKLQQIYTALTGYEHLQNYSSAADAMTKEYINDDIHSDSDMLEQIEMYAENAIEIRINKEEAVKVLDALKLVKQLKNGDGEQFAQCYEIAYNSLAN